MKTVHKFIFKSIILCVFIAGLFYYGKSKLNSIDGNIRTIFEQNNYKIDYKSKKTKFSLINSKIILYEVKIEGLENKVDASKSNMKIDEVVFSFDLFSLIFQSGLIGNIKLYSPTLNVYQEIGNSEVQKREKSYIASFISNLQKIGNSRINVQNGKIVYFNNKLIIMKEVNEISGQINNKGSLLSLNLHAHENDTDFNFKSQIQTVNHNLHSINGTIFNDREELDYKMDVEFENDNFINQINGRIDARGNDLLNLTQIFCANCKYDNAYNPNERFKLGMSVGYDKPSKSIKFDNIEFYKNNNKFNGSVLYNGEKGKFDINISGESVAVFSENENFNIFSLKNKVVNNQSSVVDELALYFDILKNFDFNFNFTVNKFKFFNQEITNLKSEIVSENKKIQIKQLTGKLKDQYAIEAHGDVLSNDIRNQLKMEVAIPFNNGSDGVNFSLSAMPGNLTINNIKIKDEKLSVIGKVLFRGNDESNDIEGVLQIGGCKLNELEEKIKKIFENNKAEKNGILSNILVIVNKMKINTNFQISLVNSVLNSNSIENIIFSVVVDDKRILIENLLRDRKFINVNNKIQISWDNLKPKVSIESKGDYLDLQKVAQIFQISNYKDYFLINAQDFKKNNDKVVWKNFNISLKQIIDINLKINTNISNVVHDAIKIDSLMIDSENKDNILRVGNLFLQIKNGSINFVGNVDVNNQIVVGIAIVKNLNFNDLKNEKKKLPVYMSASGKFATSGDNFQKVMTNLSARINYILYNSVIKNLDLNLFVNNIHRITDYSSLVSLSERSVVSGETVLNEVKGELDIKDGLLKNNFQLSSDRFTGAGIINFLMMNLTFKGISRIAFIPYQYRGTVYADIDWSGNLFNVNKSFNVENLRKIVSK
jgi:hypothetical protein